MNTIILDEPGRFRLTRTPEPDAPGPGEALVRVRVVGICGTDIHAFRGTHPFVTYPRVLGHELGVEVMAVGPPAGADAAIKVGDRCAVEPYLTCGACPPCRRGRTNCCQTLRCLGVHTDGGMREMFTVPADKLHPCDALDFDQLALIETLGIGCHAVDRAALGPGDTVAVIGLGPIGMTVVQFALIAGATVTGIDTSADRIDAAKRLFDIPTLRADPPGDPAGQWRDAFGDLPLVVFDATGNPASMHKAFDVPESGGRVVMVGLFTGELCFQDAEFHRKELTILASRNSTGRDFRRIIDLMKSNRIDVQPWITHRERAIGLPDFFGEWIAPESGMLKGMVTL